MLRSETIKRNINIFLALHELMSFILFFQDRLTALAFSKAVFFFLTWSPMSVVWRLFIKAQDREQFVSGYKSFDYIEKSLESLSIKLDTICRNYGTSERFVWWIWFWVARHIAPITATATQGFWFWIAQKCKENCWQLDSVWLYRDLYSYMKTVIARKNGAGLFRIDLYWASLLKMDSKCLNVFLSELPAANNQPFFNKMFFAFPFFQIYIRWPHDHIYVAKADYWWRKLMFCHSSHSANLFQYRNQK